jgi:hypothetical protein
MSGYFNEENTVEQMILDTLCGSAPGDRVAEAQKAYGDHAVTKNRHIHFLFLGHFFASFLCPG